MAQAGTLVFAIAGPHNAKKFVTQFLVPGVGRKVMDFGSNPERAASFKLIGNSLILSTIEMLSECMTLAEKTGAGAQQFFDFVEEFCEYMRAYMRQPNRSSPSSSSCCRQQTQPPQQSATPRSSSRTTSTHPKASPSTAVSRTPRTSAASVPASTAPCLS